MTKVTVQQEWSKEDIQDFFSDFINIGKDIEKPLDKIHAEQYKKWIEKGYTHYESFDRADAVVDFLESLINEHLK